MIRWYFLAAGVLALDQATKWIALGHLERGMSMDVLPFLSWTLTCNTGAAFSMFQGYSWVFAVAAVAVSGFLIFEIWRLPRNEREREPRDRARSVRGRAAWLGRSRSRRIADAKRRPGFGALRSGWLEGAAYGLVLAGALGNLTDRLIHECVVDFIHVHYGWFNFPVFNVADSAITVGAAGWIGLLAVDMLRRRTGRSQSA